MTSDSRKFKYYFSTAAVTILLMMNLAWCSNALAQPDFDVWLEGLRQEASKNGISQTTLDAALTDLAPIKRIIELDQRQPEFTETFLNYLEKRVTPRRIEKGRLLLNKHQSLLRKIEARYGVPPRYLVAFWGLETNFGSYLGKFPTVSALVTLAYDPRRSKFFRSQALDALRIIDQGHISASNMKGSWAGAIGQLQFLPSTFLNNAVDGNGDGKKDVWTNLSDVFASGGNFLKNIGWERGELWGREVQLPANFDWKLAQIEVRKPLSFWTTHGVTRANGQPLPMGDVLGAIVMPQGYSGPAFLVYGNFEVILKWNRSINYALAVGILADRLSGRDSIRHGLKTDNRRLSHKLTLELQQRLNSAGFNTGTPDGIPGSRTRTAVRAYQQQANLPTDGYPSLTLLEYIRRRQTP